VSSDTPYSFTVQATDFSNTVKTVQQGLSLVVKASGSSLGRNDTCSITTATPVTNGTIRASISPYGDVDVYSFQGTAGRAVTVEIVAQRLNLDGDATTTDVFFDSFLEILDASCNRRTYNDDLSSSTTDSMVSYTLPSTGTYFIRVSDLGGSGPPIFFTTSSFQAPINHYPPCRNEVDQSNSGATQKNIPVTAGAALYPHKPA